MGDMRSNVDESTDQCDELCADYLALCGSIRVSSGARLTVADSRNRRGLPWINCYLTPFALD